MADLDYEPLVGGLGIQREPWTKKVTWGFTYLDNANTGTQVQYLNRVHDTVASKMIYWVSNNAPDKTGASYPGPGAFGVTTNNYTVVRKV